MKNCKGIAVVVNTRANLPVLTPRYTNSSAEWIMSAETAKSLVGQRFSCHRRRKEVSFHQGTIINVYPGSKPRRYIVEYAFDHNTVDGKTLRWGQERALY